MTTLCLVTFSDLSALAPQLQPLIPNSRLMSLSQLALVKRKQSLLAEALARLMISEAVSAPPAELTIIRESGEKPRLSDFSLDFSISHTDGAVAVICSHNTVGADIELIREPRMRAATKYFAQNELNFVSANPNVCFWELWTRKEALCKARGTGLTAALKNDDTLSPPLSELLYTNIYNKYAVSAYSQEAPRFKLLCEEQIWKYHIESGLLK